MIHHDQWLLWAYINGAKRPLDRWGNVSASTRREDFVSFEVAKEAEAKLLVQGMAFCFTPDDPFVGIDLDNCVTHPGGYVIDSWAMDILALFDGTHIEFSPSLTGVKVFCRGSLPEGVRHRTDVSDGSVEIYDRGRFFAYTGMSCFESVDEDFEPKVTDCQTGIDWLVAEHFSEPKPVTRPVTVSSGISLGTLDSRAATYCEHCDRPLPGGRNDAAFRLSGHLFAMEHDGELLTDEAVKTHVAAWNRSLAVPLPESEIDSVVASAAKSGSPRAQKPKQATVPVLAPGVDLSFLDCAIQNGQPDKRREVFPLDPFEIPGFVGDVCRYTLETAYRRQPQLALGAALSLLSVLTGRKIEDDFLGTRTNIYAVGIAPSGEGKDAPRATNFRILTESGALELSGSESFASAAGLIRELMGHPAKLFQLDELSRYLATMRSAQRSPHLHGIPTKLMQLYTSSGRLWRGDAYADGRQNEIDEPHCVVFGTSTPEGFWQSLDPENLKDGFVGRLIVFEGGKTKMQESCKQLPIPEGIVETAKFWHRFEGQGGNLKPKPYVATYAEDAKERLLGHLRAIDKQRQTEDVIESAVWGRAGEKTTKLALLFAASRLTPPSLRIELQDVDRGIALSNWSTRRLLAESGLYVASNETESNHLRILRIIKEAGGISKSGLTRKTQWLKRRERDEIVSSLLESDQIEISEIVTHKGGRGYTEAYFNVSSDDVSKKGYFKDTSRGGS